MDAVAFRREMEDVTRAARESPADDPPKGDPPPTHRAPSLDAHERLADANPCLPDALHRHSAPSRAPFTIHRGDGVPSQPAVARKRGDGIQAKVAALLCARRISGGTRVGRIPLENCPACANRRGRLPTASAVLPFESPPETVSRRTRGARLLRISMSAVVFGGSQAVGITCHCPADTHTAPVLAIHLLSGPDHRSPSLSRFDQIGPQLPSVRSQPNPLV